MPELLRRREVAELVRLSVPTIYRMMKEDTFPRPIKLGARAVAWRREDLERWLSERPQAGSEHTDGVTS